MHGGQRKINISMRMEWLEDNSLIVGIKGVNLETLLNHCCLLKNHSLWALATITSKNKSIVLHI